MIPNKKLSLIISNYNNERYLRECIDSVLSQTLIPDEIIISDDASKDNSIKIIKEYEKKYDFIKGIYNKTNLGVSLNRHNAILVAKGKYITTLDSDDYYGSKGKIEAEVKMLEEYKREYKKDIIPYSNIVIADNMGKIIRKVFNDNNIVEGNIFNEIITRAKPIPRDYIFSKEQYFKVGGFDKNLLIYEDWDLKIRLAFKYEFFYTGVVGTVYRQTDSGLSKANYRVHNIFLDKIFYKNIKNLDLNLSKKIKYYTGFKKFMFKKYIKWIKRILLW